MWLLLLKTFVLPASVSTFSFPPFFVCTPCKLNWSLVFMSHMEPKICRFLLLPSPPPGDLTDQHTFSLRGRTNPAYFSLKYSFHSTQKAGFVSASGLCCGLFGGRTQRTEAADKPASKQPFISVGERLESEK